MANEKKSVDPTSRDILRRGQIVHLGLVHPRRKGVGYVVPMNYGFDSQLNCLFMHTGDHKGSQKMKALRTAAKNGKKVCFQVETDVQVMPMVDGSPCMSTTRYCSVLGYGKASLIKDATGMAKGLKRILRQNTGLPLKYCPRIPDDELSGIVVIKLKIAEATAHIHGYDC